jgi:aminoglycoside 6'-N-acetyltransferase I
MSAAFTIERVTAPGADWLALRAALWPRCLPAEHEAEMAAFSAEPQRYLQLIAYGSDRGAIGLAEAALRTDHVNGTSTSPVAFLEGLYVVPSARRRGVARALVQAVASWAVERGCTEIASDALLANTASHAAHRALGFEETERVVYFRRALGRQQ